MSLEIYWKKALEQTQLSIDDESLYPLKTDIITRDLYEKDDFIIRKLDTSKFIKKKISLDECKELINIKKRQYAKRQNTWARGHMKNWNKLYSKNFSILLKKTLKVVS